MLTRLLVLVHAGAGALRLGAMAYSLFTVQPKLAVMVGGDTKDAQRIPAHGGSSSCQRSGGGSGPSPSRCRA